jgi:cytoskeletal protein RodZ
VSISDTLAEARRQAGLTITQVSQQTRIRETIVRGIERGDFSVCGGDFYARGHIKSIAKVVGLDPEQAVGLFDATHGNPQTIRAAEVFEPSTPIKIKEGRHLNWTVAMAVALLAIVGFVIYHSVSGPGSKATPAAESHHVTTPPTHPAATHHPTPAASDSSSSTYRRELVVKLFVKNAPCWVEFTTQSGGYLTQATLVAGQSKTWTFRHAVSMEIGNPGAVVLTVNGRSHGSPGPVGNPITLSFRPVKQLIS